VLSLPLPSNAQAALYHVLKLKRCVPLPQAPALDLASFQTMAADYASLRDVMWSVDSSRERYIQQYGGDLLEEADTVNQQVGSQQGNDELDEHLHGWLCIALLYLLLVMWDTLLPGPHLRGSSFY
jgi:hypothetical protein